MVTDTGACCSPVDPRDRVVEAARAFATAPHPPIAEWHDLLAALYLLDGPSPILELRQRTAVTLPRETCEVCGTELLPVDGCERCSRCERADREIGR